MSSTRHRRWLTLALLSQAVGCAGSRGDVDLLEARLRDQQDLVARYERLIDSNNQQLAQARQESDLLRTQLADQNIQPLLPEHADVLLRAEKLAFHTLMTGTRDADARPGDDVLNVVLMPQAGSGEVIRLVGAIEIEALDLSRPQGEQCVGQWSFTPEQARDNWHAGFLASGFQFELPWENPATSDMVLHARLISPDGRRLEASHQVHVAQHLADGGRSTAAPLNGGSSPRIAPQQRPPVPEPIDVSLAPPTSLPSPAAPASMTSPEFPGLKTTPPISETIVDAAPASVREFPQSTTASAAATNAASGETMPAPLNAWADQPHPIDVAEHEASEGSSTAAEMPVVQPLPNYLQPQGKTSVARPIPASMGDVDIVPLSPPNRFRRTAAISADGPVSSPIIAAPNAASTTTTEPPPFPGGEPIQTSDRWTDDSIPYLR